MKKKNLFDRLATLKIPSPDDPPFVPPPEIIAFTVEFNRRVRNWKVETLADFSGVSIATIERVERGEKVSPESIEKIGAALGYEPGHLTSPRNAISKQEAMEKLGESFKHVQLVQVSRMTSQKKIREATECHGFLPNRVNTTEEVDADIDDLVEWIDVIASIFGGQPYNDENYQRRDLYKRALGCVQRIEKQGFTVLSGVMAAPLPGIADGKVSIISISPRSTDPGAIKRTQILVDQRCVTSFEWPVSFKHKR